MRNAAAVLEIIGERGRRGQPLERLYRCLFNPDLYLLAYGKILYRANTRVAGLTSGFMCGSGCSPVLVDQAGEDLAASDRTVGRDRRCRVVVGRVLAQALVRPVCVEVLGVLGEHRHGVPFAVEQQPVGALRADAAHEPLRVTVFALGARIGVRMIWTPSAVNTASKVAANLRSRSRIRYLNRVARSPRSIKKVRAHWVTHGRPGGR